MPNPEIRRAAARAKARDALAAMTEEEDKAITEAALADPDARPLDEERLTRISPVSPADAADIKRYWTGICAGLPITTAIALYHATP